MSQTSKTTWLCKLHLQLHQIWIRYIPWWSMSLQSRGKQCAVNCWLTSAGEHGQVYVYHQCISTTYEVHLSKQSYFRYISTVYSPSKWQSSHCFANSHDHEANAKLIANISLVCWPVSMMWKQQILKHYCLSHPDVLWSK